MSGPVPPVPAEEFVLPVPASQPATTEGTRISVESSLSHRPSDRSSSKNKTGLQGVWRHTIGIALLLATVFLWTASNFLASVGSAEF